jgi:hypothetical protein
VTWLQLTRDKICYYSGHKHGLSTVLVFCAVSTVPVIFVLSIVSVSCVVDIVSVFSILQFQSCAVYCT